MITAETLASFCQLVRQKGVLLYRDLPWRNTRDPYAILVSEIMLQQTQVQRVMTYWDRWMFAFPSVEMLANAGLSDVLKHWQGLGYNRRAIALKSCAEICVSSYSGQIPRSYDELLRHPGIGPATAAGVCIFAYGEAHNYLETNVRSVFIHHLFADAAQVSDREILPLIEATSDRDDPRSWYYALLDYGNYLKRTHPNPSRRSRHHSRQSSFEGSTRQKRALLLRELLQRGRALASELHVALVSAQAQRQRVRSVSPSNNGQNTNAERVMNAQITLVDVEYLLETLAAEGFLTQDSEGFWSVADGSSLLTD